MSVSAHSIDALIRQAAAKLAAAGVDTPQREARLLLALAASISTTDLIIRGEEHLSPGDVARFEAFVRRRVQREPYQHIAGRAWFHGHEFISDARALVPRGDSECVVDLALERLPRGRDVTLADLGTGSGCLLISILLQRGGVKGIGVEKDARAASLARENIKRHGVEARCTLAQQSWAEWPGWGEMDLILSNPPYIPARDIAGLDAEVRLYDPRAALDGGEDGLFAYREIIALAALRMRPGAVLVLETGFDQRREVESMLEAAGFGELKSAKDLAGHDRAVSGRLLKC